MVCVYVVAWPNKMTPEYLLVLIDITNEWTSLMMKVVASPNKFWKDHSFAG